jgi:hypothetical protein
MKPDPIMAEIRRTREDYFAQFTGDVRAMLADLKRRQQQGGRTVITRSPKRLDSTSTRSAKRS